MTMSARFFGYISYSLELICAIPFKITSFKHSAESTAQACNAFLKRIHGSEANVV